MGRDHDGSAVAESGEALSPDAAAIIRSSPDALLTWRRSDASHARMPKAIASRPASQLLWASPRELLKHFFQADELAATHYCTNDI